MIVLQTETGLELESGEFLTSKEINMSQSWKEQFPQKEHKESPMSEAEHWWNHLTYAQREFATRVRSSAIGGDKVELVSWSYEFRDHLHGLTGWPETPMRSV